MHKLKVIISGGGTGGHIFPAVAIANALKAKFAEHVDILFVGAEGRMEMEKVPAAGYKIEGLWISGLQRRLTIQNLLLPFKILKSYIKANSILKTFQPDVVVGVGGYASGIIMRAANSKKIPTLIQEQNSYPGITNKLLASKAAKICVAYEGMDTFFPANKIVLTGNPVRQDILTIANKKEEAQQFFKLDPSKKTVLVIGGSLGARTINEAINKGLQQFVDQNIQLLWQTGKGYFQIAKQSVQQFENNNIHAFDFITKMDLAYAAADLVISRAGASSISELCLVGKPSILVPSPNVAEDHQTKNAMALVTKQAAILVKDAAAATELVPKALATINNAEVCNALTTNILGLGLKDAATKIVEEIVKLIPAKH